MFALLAFALLPVAAGADSSGVQYSDAPPTATGKEIVNETPAKSSKSHNGGVSNPSNTSNSKESQSSDSESLPGSTASKSDTPPPSAGQDGAGEQRNQGQGSQQAKPKGSQPQSQQSVTKPASAESDGGSSSPLLPILILISALAAVSIGAVMLRRRRGATVKTVSPKAS
jgi:cobalamin biosynthesis Mg chelatase CobN